MRRDRSPDTSRVSPEYAGLWTVWNREQTRIIGSGHTFEEAKQAAAAAGEQAVILAKAPDAPHRRRAWRWTQVVAVFISLVPGISSLQADDWAAKSPGDATAVSRTSLDDVEEMTGPAAMESDADE